MKVSRLFLATTLVAAVPAVYASYDMRAAPLFAALLLVWGLTPIAVPYLILYFSRRLAAWGWILGVLAYSYFAHVTVLQSEGSTAFVDFLWIPVWNTFIFGPLGALIGMLVARSALQNQPPAR